jgi:hypothetical protein
VKNNIQSKDNSAFSRLLFEQISAFYFSLLKKKPIKENKSLTLTAKKLTKTSIQTLRLKTAYVIETDL